MPATKPLLMPVLAAFTLAAAGDREQEMRLPAAALALSGVGDTALLGPDRWFVPGVGAFAAAHACYITALARGGSASGVRPRVAAGYGALPGACDQYVPVRLLLLAGNHDQLG